MTVPADLQPAHKHRARALRATLAWLRGDYDVLPLLAAESETPADVDLFIVALMDSFTRVLRKRLRDPEGYLESWLAIEAAAAQEDETGVPMLTDEQIAQLRGDDHE